jgi:hypothetical protein
MKRLSAHSPFVLLTRTLRQTLAATIVGASVLGLANCAKPATQTIVVFPHGDPKVEEGPSKRSREIKRQIDVLIGTPVQIDVDDLLVRRWGANAKSSLESLESVLLGLASELGALKEESPEVFASVVIPIRKVHYVYSAIELRTSIAIDGATLRIKVADGDSCGCHGLHRALAESGHMDRERGLAELSAASVPDDRLYDYVGYRANQRGSRGRPSAYTSKDVKDFEEMLALDARAKKLRSTKDQQKIRSLIFQELNSTGDDLARAYVHNVADLASLSNNSPFRQLERRYVEMLNAGIWDAPEPMRSRMYKEALVPDGPALPGFDRDAFVQWLLDRWFQAGTPSLSERTAPDGVVSLAITFFCPRVPTKENARMVDGGCDQALYKYVRAESKRFRSFVERIASNPKASELLSISLMQGGSQASNWSNFEGNEASWTMVTRNIATNLDRNVKEDLFEEALRIWRKYPSRRPLAAVILGRLDELTHEEFSPRIRAFAKQGNQLSEAEFARYLDEGPIAFEHVGFIWPLLARGFSRPRVLELKWDTILASYTRDGFVEMRTQICDESIEGVTSRGEAVREIGQIASSLEKWYRAHPGKEQLYSDHVSVLRMESCKPSLEDQKRIAIRKAKQDAEGKKDVNAKGHDVYIP